MLGWQRTDYLSEGLDNLLGFHYLGLRSSGLSYNVGNYVGSGCVDPEPGGLSHFGVEVVRELQRLRTVSSLLALLAILLSPTITVASVAQMT